MRSFGMFAVLMVLFAAMAIQPALAAETDVKEALSPLTDKINTVYDAIIYLTLVVAPIYFAGVGIYWKSSQGKPEQELQARRMFKAGIVGLAIVLMSKIIATVVTNLFGTP